MLRRRIIMGLTVALAALMAATGAAADDGKIRQDLKDGRLDGTYTREQLSAYLNHAMTQGYGNPVATPTVPAGDVAGEQGAGGGVAGEQSPPGAGGGVAGEQSPPLAQTAQTGQLPFTGVDLALLTFGGVLMLGLGLAARRLGRDH